MDTIILNKYFPFESKYLTGYEPKIFCFHHAGGTAATYRKWTLKPSSVHFICVELPGKGARRSEIFENDFKSILDPLCQAIIEKSDGKPFLLFGHSMGAAMAFYTAYRLETFYGITPQRLIVAGRQAPNEENPIEFKTHMPDSALLDELKRYKATPKEVFLNNDLLKHIVSELRRDYELNESLIYHGERISIPIFAHAADQDCEADPDVMSRWGSVTTSRVSVSGFKGEHFFVLEDWYRAQLVCAAVDGGLPEREGVAT
ncbi:thioesterase II family protein [Sinanaerobacter sp. ZZT-01]|uniref:thioesterase II family protein n=1 Tax=Sinanaerobacter sp. ZZT-01 TaxID=3111540 RepID=UPI002D79AE75|nr:alpha/beta fold hydrolase [Sinanaerobacter sp. ZZT-01]WRR94936.1 alpha/beta fold hydrolase [Sinanaerobacter sp. ZZT-01]